MEVLYIVLKHIQFLLLIVRRDTVEALSLVNIISKIPKDEVKPVETQPMQTSVHKCLTTM